MRKYSLIALASLLSLSVACSSSSGGLAGTEVAKTTECYNDSCVVTSVNEAGSFNIAQTKDETTKELPSMNISGEGDVLTVSCGNDHTTENGMVGFTCSNGSYEMMGAVCVHGTVYLFDTDENVESTTCQSINFYCDDYGFTIAEYCNNRNLTKALVSDDTAEEAKEPVSAEASDFFYEVTE